MGLPALTMNANLCEACLRHAMDMSANDDLSHTGSDGSQAWDRASDAGYTGTVGENNGWVALWANDERMVELWMASPPHYANIAGDWKDFGVAVVQNPDLGRKFYCALFGNP